jgi:hypothetical protein
VRIRQDVRAFGRGDLKRRVAEPFERDRRRRYRGGAHKARGLDDFHLVTKCERTRGKKRKREQQAAKYSQVDFHVRRALAVASQVKVFLLKRGN